MGEEILFFVCGGEAAAYKKKIVTDVATRALGIFGEGYALKS